MDTIRATIKSKKRFSASLHPRETLNARVFMSNAQPDTYTGEYTVTPNNTVQILNTKNLLMADSVTVNPIPSNYGLITWNGSSLKVS